MAAQADYTLHDTIQDTLGDIAIVCSTHPYRKWFTVFKVSKQKLASQSTVFHDMLEAVPESEETWQELPILQLHESLNVVEILMAAVCNLPHALRTLDSLKWSDTLAVWEAANKYEMYTVRALASKSLVELLSEQNKFTEVLEVHLRAMTFEDPNLAAAALEQVTKLSVTLKKSQYDSFWEGERFVKQMTLRNRLYMICFRSKQRADNIQNANARINALLKKYMPQQEFDKIAQGLINSQKAELASLTRDLGYMCINRNDEI